MPLVRHFALALGLAALCAGLWWHPLDVAAIWPRSYELFLAAAVVAFLVAALGWSLKWPAAKLAWLVAPLVAGLLLAGWPAALATALLLLSALALGGLLPAVPAAPPLLRVLVGLGLLAGFAGWLLPFPVHHAGSWALAMLGLLAWRRRAVARDLQALADEFNQAVASAPRAGFAVGVLAVVASAPAWLPVRMADDLSYHLLLGWELQEFGHARFDVGTQVWALAPWSTDVLHALVMVLAGRESTGFLNVFWLLATAWLMRGLGVGMGLAPRWAWLASAAYLSLPLSFMLSGSLQVESATPAWLLALTTVLALRLVPGPGSLMLVAVLAGSLLGAKATNGLLLLPFFAWWLLQWRGRLPWRQLPLALGLGVLAGGSSYAYAAGLAGNPLLPLANGVFLSPWFLPENFVDPTWTQALGWDLPWRWVFEPQQFHEGSYVGAAGLVTIALLGGLPLALADARWRPLALATLAAAALLLSQIQYLRYLQPLMPMLVLLMVAGLAASERSWREWAVAAVVALQFALMPTSSWQLMGPSLRTLLTEGREAVLLRTAPERLLADFFRDSAGPGAFLLYAHSSNTAFAELPGRSAAASWHSQYVWNIRRWGADWPAMFEASGATHVITRDPASETGLPAALAARGAKVIATAGPARLYRLAPQVQTVATGKIADGRVEARLPLDPAQGLVGWLRVGFGCAAPGQILDLKWTLDRPGRNALRDWSQLACDEQSQASRLVHFRSEPVAGELVLVAGPADGTKASAVRISEALANRRRDPDAVSERFHVVWDTLCARPGCGRDRSYLAHDRWDVPEP